MQEGRRSAGPEIDINADVGESFGRWRLGDDAALVPHLTSANVACGFHAGDPRTLLETCSLATTHGVTIGAQVGYRDLAGFGRRFVDIDPADLHADVRYQVGALRALAAPSTVRYLKPHGALYHAVNRVEAQARAVVDAAVDLDRLPVLGLPGSLFLEIATSEGLPVVGEGFADRRYRDDGSLVPRSEPDAVLQDPEEAAEQALRLAREGVVQSLCVHGDTPGAPAIAAKVHGALNAAGFTVRSFA
ncbi:LamB/YcsF family protein [Nocardioides humilatus]|uniref:LamB/YcsF family protein n=1 Tax=Nocardioides humilatus TaxID=2607660 RepID=A0A5B1LN54_9ACTN|nr:5-oxoprolinase subunit PxpA [Nocardioides humilatus]KAA1421993.1 LamB/YcsF family protein [Nocardioides humilatus]